MEAELWEGGALAVASESWEAGACGLAGPRWAGGGQALRPLRTLWEPQTQRQVVLSTGL